MSPDPSTRHKHRQPREKEIVLDLAIAMVGPITTIEDYLPGFCRKVSETLHSLIVEREKDHSSIDLLGGMVLSSDDKNLLDTMVTQLKDFYRAQMENPEPSDLDDKIHLTLQNLLRMPARAIQVSLVR